jgi:hypothetical protein
VYSTISEASIAAPDNNLLMSTLPVSTFLHGSFRGALAPKRNRQRQKQLNRMTVDFAGTADVAISVP